MKMRCSMNTQTAQVSHIHDSDTVLINKGNVILSYSKCQNGEMNSNFISNYNISELSEDTSNLSLLGQPLDDDIHSDSTLSPVKKGCDYKCRNGFIDGELLRQLHSENGVTEESCKSQNDIFSNSSSESLNASDSNSSKSCNQVTVPQNINEFVDGCVNLTNKCASENSSVKNINSKVNLLPYPNENYGNGELSPLVDVENFLGTTSHFPVTKVCSCDNSKDVDRTECIEYVQYESELQMPHIMRLIQKDLSEPYSIYTYRYFIHNWPELCFLAKHKNECVGAIVCKLDHHNKVKRGYIAMLAVDENFRKKKIGSNLVHKAIKAMVAGEAGEIVLETEITNKPALKLYENLGFVRDKRLFRYYLNGVDALRLKLWIQ